MMKLVWCLTLLALLGWIADARPWPLLSAPLKVGCMADTPILLHHCIMVWPYTNKLVDSVECKLSGFRTLNCTRTAVMFTAIPAGTYRLVLTARTATETASATYRLIIPANYRVCTSHLINDGVTINNHTAVVDFSGYGPYNGFNCKFDSPVQFPCQSPLILEDLIEGKHWVRVIPNGCQEEERQTFFFTIPSATSTASATSPNILPGSSGSSGSSSTSNSSLSLQ